MVDKRTIERILDKSFTIAGAYEIDDQGVVNVGGSVALHRAPQDVWPHIPVKFGRVSHIFEAIDVNLMSLENAPRWVGSQFKVNNNLLKDLTHAPDHVGGDLDAHENPKLTHLNCAHVQIHGELDVQRCDLISMESCPQVKQGIWIKGNPRLRELKGITPTHHVFVDYDPDLHLLPALVVQEIHVRNVTQHFPYHEHAATKLREILKKYQGKGKAAMLNCALELKKAGFKGNAKW